MTDVVCTFGAKPGPLYTDFETVPQEQGCCVLEGTGDVTSAYGINDTCHVLLYEGDAAPYRLTFLTDTAGNLSMTTGECIALVMNIEKNGEYSPGTGYGPTDAGLASKYGYHKCVVDVSACALVC